MLDKCRTHEISARFVQREGMVSPLDVRPQLLVPEAEEACCLLRVNGEFFGQTYGADCLPNTDAPRAGVSEGMFIMDRWRTHFTEKPPGPRSARTIPGALGPVHRARNVSNFCISVAEAAWVRRRIQLLQFGIPSGSVDLARFCRDTKISEKWSISVRSRTPMSPLLESQL